MSKLRIIRLYRDNDVPDHLLQEVNDMTEKLGHAFQNFIDKEDPSIIMSAFNRLHAALIVHLVTKEGLSEAAKTEAIGLMKNVEHISGQKVFLDDS